MPHTENYALTCQTDEEAKQRYQVAKSRAQFLSVAGAAIESLADLRRSHPSPWPEALETFEKSAHAVLDAYLKASCTAEVPVFRQEAKGKKEEITSDDKNGLTWETDAEALGPQLRRR